MRKHAKSKTSRRLKSGGKRQPFPKASRSSPGSSLATGSKASTARAISNGFELNLVEPDKLTNIQIRNARSHQTYYDLVRAFSVTGDIAASCRIPRP